MSTTTSYGTWNNRVEHFALTVEQTVVEALGDYAHEYDVEAIARDYRDAINKALPQGVTLAGDEFIGPHHPNPREFEGYPVDDRGVLDIKAIVDTVDFWEIANRHERTV